LVFRETVRWTLVTQLPQAPREHETMAGTDKGTVELGTGDPGEAAPRLHTLLSTSLEHSADKPTSAKLPEQCGSWCHPDRETRAAKLPDGFSSGSSDCPPQSENFTLGV
jgi:hypothetical protein